MNRLINGIKSRQGDFYSPVLSASGAWGGNDGQITDGSKLIDSIETEKLVSRMLEVKYFKN